MYKTLPGACARLITISERDPRRGVVIARRAYNHQIEAQTTGEGLAIGWYAYTLSAALVRWERFDEARLYIEQALATFSAAHIQDGQRACRFMLLCLKQLGGAGAELQAEWQRLASEHTAAGEQLLAMRVQFEQAAQLNLLGRPHEALALTDHLALLVAREGAAQDHARLARLRAVAYGECGALTLSLTLFNTAIASYAAIRRPSDVATCLVNRAWIHQRREVFAAARDDLERAAAILQRFQLTATAAFCTRSLGMVAARLGFFDRALNATLRARADFAELNRPLALAGCDLHLGIISYYLGLFEVALAAYARAQAAFAALDMPRWQLVCRRNEALVLRAQGQAAAALAALRADEAQAALLDGLEQAENLHAQGLALTDLHQGEAALAVLVQAEARFTALGNDAAAAECRVDYARLLLRQSRFDAAATLFEAARLALADRPIHAWRIEAGLAVCAQERGDGPTALAHYRAASTMISTLRRQLASEHASSGLFAQASQLYDAALHLAAEQGEPQIVLELDQQQRALAMMLRRVRGSVELPANLRAEHAAGRALLQRLIAERAQTSELDAALTAYSELLLHLPHHPSSVDDDVSSLDLAALRLAFDDAFPEGWDALNYSFAGNELLIVCFNRYDTLLSRVRLDEPLRTRLREVSQASYRLMTYRDLAFVRGKVPQPWAALVELGQALLPESVRARLHPRRRLLIVPGGALHGLAWGALRVAGSWLCQQTVLQIVPSLALWPQLAHTQPSGDRALLVGCASFGERAPPLPHAQATLDLALTHWHGPSERLQEEEASRAAVELRLAQQHAGYGLIHIASHAQLVAARGLLAHLKLADDDLLFDELARLRIGGALVVLVACDGALGEVLPGEEVVSLSNALLGAGARDVIASHWQLHDHTILALLAPFYAALAQGADPPTALALAQRALIAQGNDGSALAQLAAEPYVWACLSAIGAGTRVRATAGDTRPAAASREPTSEV